MKVYVEYKDGSVEIKSNFKSVDKHDPNIKCIAVTRPSCGIPIGVRDAIQVRQSFTPSDWKTVPKNINRG